jgi:hypothetical protein
LEYKFFDNPMDVPVCYEYRPYWISWADGYIQLGRGSVINVNMIAGWTDPNHFEVKRIGIITTWGSSGDDDGSNKSLFRRPMHDLAPANPPITSS